MQPGVKVPEYIHIIRTQGVAGLRKELKQNYPSEMNYISREGKGEACFSLKP